jgi:hypothetical protein
MFTSIRWSLDTVDLECFPSQTQEALMNLQPGTFTAIRISVETQLCVKRLTEKAFQTGAWYKQCHLAPSWSMQ